jgi:hypothetical protein
VDIAWRALNRSTTDYTAFVHLVDGQQKIVAQQDQPPGGPNNPTTRWVPGEIVRSRFTIKPPKGTVYEGLKLRVGLYEPISGKQVPLTGVPSGQVSTSSASYLMLPLGR